MNLTKNSMFAIPLLLAVSWQQTHAFTAPTNKFTYIHHNNQLHNRDLKKTGKIDHVFEPSSLNIFRATRDIRTTLNMVAPSPTGAAAVIGVISGGILGGALHAIAGKSIMLYVFLSI